MSQNTFTVDSGTTSVFLDLPLLESAAGITFVGADSTGEPASDEFQIGFPIVEDTDFTFETPPVVPVSGSFEHSGTITLGVGGADITLGEFSIAFDEARVSDTASGFFVADTTDDALGLEVLFDVGVTGDVAADSGSLTISDKDLLLAPELADALGDTALTGADVGDVQIDAATSSDVTTDIDTSSDTDTAVSTSSDTDIFISPADEEIEVEPITPDIFSVTSGTTSVFLDLPVLESAAGITLVGADSTGEPASDEFQVGFPIIEDTDFTFEAPPVVPIGGSFEHSGTITLGIDDTDVTVGEFSIAFDEARISDTASGFFVADTTEEALGLDVLFDVGIPGEVSADAESLTIADKDLLIAPELADALGASELAGADVGDFRIDASTSSDTDIFIAPTDEEVINLLEAEDLTIDLSAVVNASNENIGGFYQAIDETGTVIDPVSGAEITVVDEGYIDSAIANSVAEIGDGEATTLDLEGDFVYVPYLLADGVQFFSSFAEVNPEGFDNVESLGEKIFGFEDEIGGGDLDFDDFVLTAETV